MDFVNGDLPQINSGINVIDSIVNPVLSGSLEPAPGASINPSQIQAMLFTWVWMARRSLRHTFIWIRQLSAAEKEVENFYCSARKYTAERICRYSICYGIFPACHLSAL